MGEYPHFSFNSIDDMLAFLPEFERGEFASADRHYQQTGKHLPQVQRFRNAIYATGFAFPFERVAWEEQEGQIATSSDRIPGADLLTLRKILTAFVRQEEFLEGFIPIAGYSITMAGALVASFGDHQAGRSTARENSSVMSS